jgi:prolyl oligopeptidase PreP (S9A serine peptidase family)
MIYAALAAIYTLGVVHVTSTYTNSRWTSKELKRTEEFLQKQSDNEALKQEISKLLQANLALSATNGKKLTKELLDALAQDPRYKSCRTTDSVRDALQRKLDSQPK